MTIAHRDKIATFEHKTLSSATKIIGGESQNTGGESQNIGGDTLYLHSSSTGAEKCRTKEGKCTV